MNPKSKSTFNVRLATALGITITSLAAAPVIYEPFAQDPGALNNQATGTGLTGNWTANGNWQVESGTMLSGSLASTGNKLLATTGGGGGRAFASTGTSLSDANLLDDGASLWFSVIYTTTPSVSGNPDAGFALGTAELNGTNNVPMGTGNSGIGFSVKNGRLVATTWINGDATRTINATHGPTVAGSTTYLVVGEIIWGADSVSNDTINLYFPDANLNLGTAVGTTSAVLDQSAFTTLSYAHKNDSTPALVDEIRFGATSADVLPVDTVAPTLVSITDDKGGGPIGEDVVTITYDLTFDKHMDLASFQASDFDTVGTATTTIGNITQSAANIIRVEVLPTTTGTVQLRIPATSEILSLAQVALDTTSDILDDTTITIDAGSTPNTPGSDRWWDLATSGTTDGVSQGGTGNWNTTTTNWDRGPGFEAPVSWDNTNANTAVFGGTAGTVTLDEDITLNGLTVSLPTAGGSGYSIGNVGEDHTLTFTGDKLVTITATGNGSNQDTIIRAGIAGAPTMDVAGRNDNNNSIFQLLPGADVTQTIGTLNMLNTLGSNKRLILGGDSTGNVVDTVTWPVTNQQMFLTKRGAGDWTITNDLAFGTNRASRLYVEQGTLTLGDTNNSSTHKVGVATVTGSTFTATNLASKLIAKGTFTIQRNDEYFFVQNAGTLSPGPGVETLTIRWNQNVNNTATHGQFNMQTGSTYEWDVASSISTDVIDVQRGVSNVGNLILGDMTIKVNDAGVSTDIAATDQLTVFTYQSGVTRSIGTVTIDTTSLGAGWSGTPSLVDDDNGTIYITGLSYSSGGPSSPYDTWAASFLPTDVSNPTGDFDNDGLSNLLEFAFGTDPTISDAGPLTWDGVAFTPGSPVIHVDYPIGGGVDFTARFIRRTDHGDSGSAAYAWQFSSDLSDWEASDDAPAPDWLEAPNVLATDGDYQLVEVPYPFFLDSGKKARFFRVEVTEIP